MKKLYILFLLAILVTGVRSQVHYPVRTYTTVNPPAPWSLDGFVSVPGKLNLQVVSDDISLQEYPVKLRISIKGNGLHIYTRPDYTPAPFYLEGGLTETLTGSDLEDLLNPANLVFEGYSKSRYRENGRLPEGVYRISFEVVDYHRDVVISQAFPAVVMMYLAQAPRLLSPRAGEEVNPATTGALRFSWMTQGISTPLSEVLYTFRIWEIRPEGRNAEEIVRSSRPLYQSETDQSWVLYDATLPALESGREYAWEVAATDRTGNVLFRNEGRSEVSTFIYGERCAAPSPYITGVTTTSASLRWNYDPSVNHYRLFLKKESGEEWEEQETSSPGCEIKDLSDYTLYQVKVQSICAECESEESAPLEFRTDRDVDYTCGTVNSSIDLSNNAPLPGLYRFDTFKASDFLVEVESVEGGNGRYSGTGLLMVPYLGFVKFKVRFDNIFINSDYRMTDGAVVFVYDESTGMVVSEEDLTGETTQTPGNKAVDVREALEKGTDLQVHVEGEAESIKVEGNRVTITTVDGRTQTITVSEGGTVGILPSGGEDAYVADTSTGRVYSFPKQSSGTPGEVHSPVQSGAYGGKVSFSASEYQRYGLDIPGVGKGKPDDWFERDKSRTPVAWKSLEAGMPDYVDMSVDGDLEADSLRYIRDSGFPVPTSPLNGSGAGRSLLLTGGIDGDREMLSVARVTQKPDIDSTEVLTEAGALGLATYGREDRYVKLVKVCGALSPDNASPVEAYLNRVYGPAVVIWHVSTGPAITESELPDLDPEGFGTGNTGMLSRYTSEMKRVYKYYKKVYGTDKNTQYLFFIDSPGADKKGFMPLTGQYGFIFNFGINLETIAHELGHGTFNLRHTFSEESPYRLAEGTTGNLMDYGSPQGTELWKYQWDLIHDPENVLFSWTQEESEGAYTWSFFGEEYARLFNHVYDNNNEDNSIYLDKINNAGGNETIKLGYTESEINKWSKDEKAFIDSWSIGTYDGDKIAKSVFDKIKSAKKDAEIEDINLSANRIYIGSFTIGDKAYPVATYAPKGVVSGIKKITVTESEALERTDTIKHIYCDETYTKYLIIAFYKEGAEKTDPSLIMQIEKFIGDDTKDKWLEYLGVLVEKTKPPVVTDTIKIFITRTNTGTNSTTGTLKTDDETITGYTVELPRGNDSECKTSCADDEIPFDCHCIIEGVYEFEINTKVYDAGSPKNHSLRIISTVQNGRSGVLVHGGRDDAKGWSMGCILPMPNEPEKNSELYSQGRNNTKTQSVDFTKTIIDWVKQREAEIKKNNKDIKKVEKRIIITKTF